MDVAELLGKRFDDYDAAQKDARTEMSSRLDVMERKMTRWAMQDGPSGGGFQVKTLGEGLVEDERLGAFIANGARGHYRYEYKTITSGSSSGGATAAPDY